MEIAVMTKLTGLADGIRALSKAVYENVNTICEELPLHPACAAWPEMSPGALCELAEDIAANGLRESITLTPANELLDGRNRYKACVIAGVKPTTVVYAGDPFLFSLSMNKHRRHMSVDDIAMVAAMLVTTEQGMNQYEVSSNELTIAAAATASGVSETAIKSARTILRDGTPQEIEAVKTGRAKLRATADAVRARKKPEVVLRDYKNETGEWPTAQKGVKLTGLSSRNFDNALRAAKAFEAGQNSTEKMVSVHVLIEELHPLFQRVLAQSKMHDARVSKGELAMIAGKGQRLLDQWASNDPSVRRLRGQVVPLKQSAKERMSDVSSLESTQ